MHRPMTLTPVCGVTACCWLLHHMQEEAATEANFEESHKVLRRTWIWRRSGFPVEWTEFRNQTKVIGVLGLNSEAMAGDRHCKYWVISKTALVTKFGRSASSVIPPIASPKPKCASRVPLARSASWE